MSLSSTASCNDGTLCVDAPAPHLSDEEAVARISGIDVARAKAYAAANGGKRMKLSAKTSETGFAVGVA